MNSNKMVKISNRIGFIAVLALVYWVLIFITTQIFGLRIFKETLTATFNWSILGILVLMFGALIINIMFNLSRIADKINNGNETIEKTSIKKRTGTIIFIASLPIIIITLFFGNYLSSKKIENELKKSADAIINSFNTAINELSNYSFDTNWINKASNLFSLMVRIDSEINNVGIIFEDEIDGNIVYLTVVNGNQIREDDVLNKIYFIRNYKLKEREYIAKYFRENYNQKYFLSENGVYNLFVPYENSNKKILFFFSNRREYGSLSK